MPNKRAKGQKLLPFAAKVSFVQALDRALVEIGCSNRSQFIRQSIVEKLALAGVKIPPHLADAPPRTGALYKEHTAHAAELNEAINSSVPNGPVEAVVKKAVKYAIRKNKKSGRAGA